MKAKTRLTKMKYTSYFLEQYEVKYEELEVLVKKAVDVAKLLQVSEGLVSNMLNYKKGLSKDTIRILSERFKLNQEAFNRPYELHVPQSTKFKHTRLKNSRKKLVTT
jgi:plasmid maintenance system antidote protein VapI